jgi:hypothetical protein
VAQPEPHAEYSSGLAVRAMRFIALFVAIGALGCLPTLLVAWLTSNLLIAIAVGSMLAWAGFAYITVRAGFKLSHALWFMVPGIGFFFMLWVLWEASEPGVLSGAGA